MSKPPTDIFPNHVRTEVPPFGCDRDRRAWMAKRRTPAEVKDAILAELDYRGRLHLINPLMVELMRLERGEIEKRIHKRLGRR